MLNPQKKYKRPCLLFDEEKKQNVRLERVISKVIFLVQDDNGEYYHANTSHLSEPKGKTYTSITIKSKTVKSSEKQQLNEFFDRMAAKMPLKCQNCGKKLNAYTKWAKRCCTAHLFPKSIFKSIATNELNIVFMGTDLIGYNSCNCHTQYDANLENRKRMQIYDLAIERLYQMNNELSQADWIKACDYLGINFK